MRFCTTSLMRNNFNERFWIRWLSSLSSSNCILMSSLTILYKKEMLFSLKDLYLISWMSRVLNMNLMSLFLKHNNLCLATILSLWRALNWNPPDHSVPIFCPLTTHPFLNESHEWLWFYTITEILVVSFIANVLLILKNILPDFDIELFILLRASTGKSIQ